MRKAPLPERDKVPELCGSCGKHPRLGAVSRCSSCLRAAADVDRKSRTDAEARVSAKAARQAALQKLGDLYIEFAASPEGRDRRGQPDHPVGEEATQIDGQMLKIRLAIEEELADGAPIAALKPGQVWKRCTDRMRNVWRCAPGEIPHRITFDRFRRLHGLLPPWRAKACLEMTRFDVI
jgi:hypothetical protein